MNKLNKEEFKAMIKLIKRFGSTELDQFAHWKVDTEYGEVYIEISRSISGDDSFYIDLDSYLNS